MAAFALAGHLALYTWLRATGEIEIIHWEFPDASIHAVTIQDWTISIENTPAPRGFSWSIWLSWPWAVFQPAVALEIALDRRGLGWIEHIEYN